MLDLIDSIDSEYNEMQANEIQQQQQNYLLLELYFTKEHDTAFLSISNQSISLHKFLAKAYYKQFQLNYYFFYGC